MPLEKIQQQLGEVQIVLARRKTAMVVGLAALALLLVALVFLIVRLEAVGGKVGEIQATSNRRIGQLEGENRALSRELARQRQLRAEEAFTRGVIEAERDALAVQLFLAGLQPVVSNPTRASAPGSTPAPASTPTEAAPTPATNPSGKAPPGQQKQCTVNVFGICV